MCNICMVTLHQINTLNNLITSNRYQIFKRMLGCGRINVRHTRELSNKYVCDEYHIMEFSLCFYFIYFITLYSNYFWVAFYNNNAIKVKCIC